MNKSQYFCSRQFDYLDVWYLVEYRKYWIDKATKTKNQKFNSESGMILDFKQNPPNGKTHDAVNFFAKQLLEELKADQILWGQQMQIAIVPSSTVGRTSDSLVAIAKFLQARNKNYVFNGNPLRRKISIPKLATGGSRDFQPMYNSLEIDSPEPPQAPVCLLLDDVLTSGSSLSSCSTHLLEWGFKRVIPIVLGKTTND